MPLHTPEAILRAAPDIDLQGRLKFLEEAGIRFEPIDPDSLTVPSMVPVLYLFPQSWWCEQTQEARQRLLRELERDHSALILAGSAEGESPSELENLPAPSAWIDQPIREAAVRRAVRSMLGSIRTRLLLVEQRFQLEAQGRQVQELHRVGIALSAEQDLESLQNLILTSARRMTSADAGTLYLVDESPSGEKNLLFFSAQCDSVEAPHKESSIPLDTSSIAGFVACTGENVRLSNAYSLPRDASYSFSPEFDRVSGYRTRSMLAVPMHNHEHEVVGVIQLINRKRNFEARVATPDAVEREVEPFTDEDEQLLLSFASQAAVALENRRLVESIQNLFAGFVRASVTAIEARDPTTSGHSDRVAKLTVALARGINRVEAGPWKDVYFSDQQIREVEYAGLLHDFGKVGVREHVLVKARKLYDWQLDQVRARFAYARKVIEARCADRKLELAISAPRDRYFSEAAGHDAECRAELDRLSGAWDLVQQANEPALLEDERAQILTDLSAHVVWGPAGEPLPLLSEQELHSLTIRRGTLDEQERLEIESHVTHSFNFLVQIPWTRELSRVPELAHAHHEKLDGTGYPRGLTSDQIPLQARMMTISDIFDALTARDRPYKLAVPTDRALDILHQEAEEGKLDMPLLDLFVRLKVYQILIDPSARRGSP